MRSWINIILITVLVLIASCSKNSTQIDIESKTEIYHDVPFIQEYHEGYKISDQELENNIRDVAVDFFDTVWVATADGVFKKAKNSKVWVAVIKGKEKGPSYAIEIDALGVVWMAVWNGVYKYENSKLIKVEGVIPPISVLANSEEGIYALGPKGIWVEENTGWKNKNYAIARSVRSAKSDGKKGLWVATDVGLYHCNSEETLLYQDKNELISCYLKGMDFDSEGNLWLAGLGGVTIRDNTKKTRVLNPEHGLSSVYVNSIKKAPDGTMWIGTKVGVVRFDSEGNHSLRFSKRWLLDDEVMAVDFDSKGNAWIATSKGVSAIKKREMTLESKENYFYNVLMNRHIREPWIAHVTALDQPGAISTSKPVDDDNDGQYTGMYLVMEALKYEVTGDENSKIRARKALNFLMKLQTITETKGFFARTIVPATWDKVRDKNRSYTKKQLADALVNEVRFKPVEKRWHLSKDKKWLWKGDTSSDELCGHIAAYYFYYEHVANQEEKELVKNHVKRIMDYLIENNLNLNDIDGKHTYWGVWSPDKLNGSPDWAPERGINSLEILSFLKLTYHMTTDEKYEELYLNLIHKEGYLENAKRIISSNAAWTTYIDPELLFLTFPPLFKYEKDTMLLNSYTEIIDTWYQNFRKDKSPFYNFMYTYIRGESYDLEESIFFMKDTPLDLVDWYIDHSKREDLIRKRYPVLEKFQTSVLVPPSERGTVRWDKNPWQIKGGNPLIEKEPVFWLLPYWLGRYTGAIEN